VTDDDRVSWQAPEESRTPYVAEWDALITAIRNDLPHNETRRAIHANLATIMGRAAIHSGRTVTWDQVMRSEYSFCDSLDDLGFDFQPPVLIDADGRYPAPHPGKDWIEV
jgi:hypothetical protein